MENFLSLDPYSIRLASNFTKVSVGKSKESFVFHSK
jgi:hypothetical protein